MPCPIATRKHLAWSAKDKEEFEIAWINNDTSVIEKWFDETLDNNIPLYNCGGVISPSREIAAEMDMNTLPEDEVTTMHKQSQEFFEELGERTNGEREKYLGNIHPIHSMDEWLQSKEHQNTWVPLLREIYLRNGNGNGEGIHEFIDALLFSEVSFFSFSFPFPFASEKPRIEIRIGGHRIF